MKNLKFCASTMSYTNYLSFFFQFYPKVSNNLCSFQHSQTKENLEAFAAHDGINTDERANLCVFTEHFGR